MRFASTRGQSPPATFSEALLQGLAPDGGLYVPQQWPPAGALQPGSLPELGRQLIGIFAAGDALADAVPTITADAFNFPAPLKALPGPHSRHFPPCCALSSYSYSSLFAGNRVHRKKSRSFASRRLEVLVVIVFGSLFA